LDIVLIGIENKWIINTHNNKATRGFIKR